MPGARDVSPGCRTGWSATSTIWRDSASRTRQGAPERPRSLPAGASDGPGAGGASVSGGFLSGRSVSRGSVSGISIEESSVRGTAMGGALTRSGPPTPGAASPPHQKTAQAAYAARTPATRAQAYAMADLRRFLRPSAGMTLATLPVDEAREVALRRPRPPAETHPSAASSGPPPSLAGAGVSGADTDATASASGGVPAAQDPGAGWVSGSVPGGPRPWTVLSQ